MVFLPVCARFPCPAPPPPFSALPSNPVSDRARFCGYNGSLGVCNLAKLILLTGGIRKEFDLGDFNTIGRHPDNSVQILTASSRKSMRTSSNRAMAASCSGSRLAQRHLYRQHPHPRADPSSTATRSPWARRGLLFSDRPSTEESLHRVTIARAASTRAISGTR